MNGVVSGSMKEAGIGYRLNYGVALPQLRQIADECGKDEELAVALWKEEIRECRILAALIYPQERFMPDMADLWVEQIVFPDLAEVCAMYLFSRMNGASELAFRWIASHVAMTRYCGLLMIVHLLRKGDVMMPRYKEELTDQALTALSDGDLKCAQAARSVLDCLSGDGER